MNKSSKTANDNPFYLQEYDWISYWPYRLSAEIRGNSNQPLDEDTAEKIIETAIGDSLKPSELSVTLKRKPLTNDAIQQLVASLSGALKFRKYIDIDLDWFEESLHEIANQRNEPIASRFIVYRVANVPEVDDEDEDEFDDDFDFYLDELESSIVLVDQLTGIGWKVENNLFTIESWGEKSIPTLSVSPALVHAISPALRSEELKAMDVPKCVAEDLNNAIPSKVTELNVEFNQWYRCNRDWIPIAVIHNNQMVPCHNTPAIALKNREVFYLCGMPGLAIWSHYDPNFLMNEMSTGFGIDEVEDGNRMPDSDLIAATGVIMKLLAENSNLAFDENSSSIAARAFRSSTTDLAIILLNLQTSLISGPENFEMESNSFHIQSPVIEELSDANYDKIPVGENGGGKSLIGFLSTHKQIQLVEMDKYARDEFNDVLTLAVKNKPSAINAACYVLKGTMDGKDHFYRGVYKLIDGQLDVRHQALELVKSLTEQDLTAICLNGSTPVGIDETGNLKLTDFYSVEVCEHYLNPQIIRAYIKNSLLTHEQGPLVFYGSMLRECLDDNMQDKLKYYQDHIDSILMNDIPNLGLGVSPLKTRQMLNAAMGKVTNELIESGVDFENLRECLVNEVNQTDWDFVDELTFWSTRYMEGHYVIDEDREIPRTYEDTLRFMYNRLYVEADECSE